MMYCDGKPITDDCESCECDLIDVTTFEDILKGNKRYIIANENTCLKGIGEEQNGNEID